MSVNVTRILCLIFYALLIVLILVVVALYVFEMKFNSRSCGMSKEFLEIIQMQNRTESGDNDNDPNFDFTGHYKLIKSENFDSFLEELGVGYFQRTIANKASSEYEIERDGEKYTLRTISPFRTSEISFTLDGKEFEEERMDGTAIKSTMTRKGKKWIHIQKDGEKEVKIVREWKDDSIVVTGSINSVVFVRIYKKVTGDEQE